MQLTDTLFRVYSVHNNQKTSSKNLSVIHPLLERVFIRQLSDSQIGANIELNFTPFNTSYKSYLLPSLPVPYRLRHPCLSIASMSGYSFRLTNLDYIRGTYAVKRKSGYSLPPADTKSQESGDIILHLI